jgi:hypothetical protein
MAAKSAKKQQLIKVNLYLFRIPLLLKFINVDTI